MRKNKVIVMLTLLVIGGFAFQSLSAEQKPLATKPMTVKTGIETPRSGINNTTGKIAKIDKKESTLTVAAKTGNLLTVTVDKNSLLYKGGKNIKITEFKKGDQVGLDYETKGGQNLAKTVRVEGTKK